MNEYIFHNDLLNNLLKNNIHNYIIYGPNGCGKRFLVKKLMLNKFNIDIDKNNYFNFKTKINNNNYDIDINKSIYHYDIIINKNTITYENIIINFLKNFIISKNICNKNNIFIISNLTSLNNLQLFISKCIDNSIHKFIILTNNYSSLSSNLKSRCTSIRLSIPKINNHLSLLDIPEYKKKIIIKKYSYNLNIYFESLQIIHLDNYETILDTNKINTYFDKLIHNIKLKRISSLNNIRDIIYELQIFNNINIIKEFYIYLLEKNIFKSEKNKLLITNKFIEIESLSKYGNNNIFFFENIIIYLKLIYHKI